MKIATFCKKKTIFFLVRARLCSTVTQRVSQPRTWRIKFPIKNTHPHNLGSLLLVLKISLKSFVHLYPSAKSLSLQGKCCLRSGSKDDILVGLLEQYHWGEPVCFKNSAVLLTAWSIWSSLKYPPRHWRVFLTKHAESCACTVLFGEKRGKSQPVQP